MDNPLLETYPKTHYWKTFRVLIVTKPFSVKLSENLVLGTGGNMFSSSAWAGRLGNFAQRPPWNCKK